jgi:hypothetical protein
LIDFLDNGGRLYIESVNIGTDHENTTFFDYLGVSLKDGGSDYEVNTLKGSCAECSELLKYHYMGGVSPHYKVDQLLADGGTALLSSEEGHGRMFVYEDMDYRVITSSVVMGAIANADSLSIKPYLLSEFVNYFIGYNPATSLAENVSSLIEGRIFPNPIQDRAFITFNLDRDAHVSVMIHDINGRVIKEIASKPLQQGQHTLVWDATDNSGQKVEHGFYFCSLQTSDFAMTWKLIILP